MTYRSTLLLLALAFAPAGPAWAYSAEYARAFAATMADPRDVDALMAFAEIALREGDEEGAISALERLLVTTPDLPGVRVQLGGLYLRLGAHAQARLYAESALQSARIDAATRAKAERLIALAETGASRHRFGGRATLAGGYQSNANAAPSASSVTVGGTTYELDSDSRAQADGNAMAAAAFDYTYDPKAASGLTLDVSLAGSYTRQFEITDYNIGTAGLAVGPRIPLSDASGRSSLWAHGLTSLVSLGDALYSTGFGAGLTLVTAFDRSFWLDVVLEASYVVYHDGDVAPNASDQTGFAPRGVLQLRYRLLDNLWILGGARGSTTRAGEASVAHTTVGPFAGVSVPFLLPIDAPPWSVDVVYTHTFTSYDEPGALDPDTTREDTESRVVGLIRMPLTRDLSIFGSGGYTRHDSNLDFYSWSGVSGSVGATYRFGAAP